MKSYIGILVAFLVSGMAAAFFRPAKPFQIPPAGPAEVVYAISGLDNEAIPSDNSIHPARKCASFVFVRCRLSFCLDCIGLCVFVCESVAL